MNTTQRDKIIEHGINLNYIFDTDFESLELCKKLHRIENNIHFLAVKYCNGEINMDQWETYTNKTIKKLDKILKFKDKKIPVFINADPRGYALKIEDSYIRENNIAIYRDIGGYGILSPEIEG